MSDEALSGLFGIIQSEGAKRNPPSICVGVVVTPPPNLSIKIGDLVLLKDDLKVADYLLLDYKRKLEIKGKLQCETNETGGGSGDASFASHNHAINADVKITEGELIYKDTIKAGDEVAMLSSYDGNMYYVLFKVVSL